MYSTSKGKYLVSDRLIERRRYFAETTLIGAKGFHGRPACTTADTIGIPRGSRREECDAFIVSGASIKHGSTSNVDMRQVLMSSVLGQGTSVFDLRIIL